MERVKVGVIGCGNISGIYFENMTQYPALHVVAAADLEMERARASAEKYGLTAALTPEALLAHPDIEIVVNLTVPKAHDPVNRQAVRAGKHVYVEKPLALDREEVRETLRIAKEKGLRVGGAPDTFLGAGHQTARALVDSGAIGTPVGFNAFMLCPGHESWHPSPEFYYEPGGGPLFDMGPYYLTALVNLLGPIRAVQGVTRISFPTRTITSQPKAGKVIEVQTPTHIVAILEFANGAVGQLTTSFDVQASRFANIEVYGSEGTLAVPDPNGFGGPLAIRRRGSDWNEVDLTHSYPQNSRGLGVLDMAYSIRTGRVHRADDRLTFHVLDAMAAILESGASGERRVLESAGVQPAALEPDPPAFGLKG